uniref:Uncharacterized protein n=1 Tax=Gracilinema caldarium TaxID=215591 RepID=A0A7C3E0S7_9SPIR
MVKTSFQEMVDGSFQSLQAMEAQQKLQYIRICEQNLQKLEDELNAFLEQAEMTTELRNKG